MTEAPNVNQLISKGYKREGNKLLSPTEKYPSYIGRDRKDWKNYNKHVVYLNSGGQPIKEEYFIPYSNYMGNVTEYMKVGVQKRITYDSRGFKTSYEEYERYRRSKREQALKLRLKQKFVNDYEAGERKVQTQEQDVEDVVSPYRTKKAPAEQVRKIKSIQVGEKNYAYLGKGTEAFAQKKVDEANTKIVGKKTVGIALEKGGASKINKMFSSVGVHTAKDYFEAVKSKKITKEGDKFIIKTEPKQTKNYYGWTDTLTNQAKQFFKVASGDFSELKGTPPSSRVEKFLVQSGGALGGVVTTGLAGVSSLAEQGLFWVNSNRPEISDINTTFEDSRRAQQKYDEQMKESQFFLGMLGTGVTEARFSVTEAQARKGKISPSEFEKISAKFNKQLKTEPSKFSKQVLTESGELKGIQPSDESLGLVKAEQVQLQLGNKKLVFDEKSIFAPPEYKPMSFFELAKQNPELAREFTRTTGQRLLDTDIFSKLSPEEFKTPSRLRQVYDEIASENAKLRTEKFKAKDMLETAKEQVSKGARQTKIGEAPSDSIYLNKNIKLEAERIRTVNIKDSATGKTKSFFFGGNTKGQQSITTDLGKYYERTKFGYYESKFKPDLPDFTLTGTGKGGLVIVPINFLDKNLNPDVLPGLKGKPGIKPININALTLSLESTAKARISADYKSDLDKGLKLTYGLELENPPVYRVSKIQIQQPRISTENLLTTEQTPRQRITPIMSFPRTIIKPQNNIIESPFKFQKIGFPSLPKTSPKFFKGYDVFLRRGGKFNKINFGGALPRAEAMGLGSFTADTTAGASFKILPSKDSSRGSYSGGSDLSKFYKSTREKGVYIEKPKFRISTPGEKTEITFKGIFTSKNKRKKKKKGLFDFGL